MEILPQPAISVIELSSTTTQILMVASPPILDYHLGASPTYEEDPSEETSTATSHAPNIAWPSCAYRVEVLSRHLRIIHTPLVS